MNGFLHSKYFDLAFYLLPLFIAPIWILLGIAPFTYGAPEARWHWWIFFILIDAGHVFSTAYITYLDKQLFRERYLLFILTPSISAIVLIFIRAYFGSPFLWITIGYLAMYHFIRQQWGFVALYGRSEQEKIPVQLALHGRQIDFYLVHFGLIYAYLYFHQYMETNAVHLMLGRKYFQIPHVDLLMNVVLTANFILLLLFTIKELYFLKAFKVWTWQKQLVIVGTFLVWYTGLIFRVEWPLAGIATVTFIHGFVYWALVWSSGSKRASKLNQAEWPWRLFRISNLPLFLGGGLVYGFFSFGFWELVVNKGDLMSLGFFKEIQIPNNESFKVILEVGLGLPQVTHYILDGFIWRRAKLDKKPLLGEEIRMT